MKERRGQRMEPTALPELPPDLHPASIVLVSAVLPAAIGTTTLKSSGDAIAAELTSRNFLPVKFKHYSVII